MLLKYKYMCIFFGPKETYWLRIYMRIRFNLSWNLLRVLFSVLVEKGRIRVWIVSKKNALGQKSATSKKKFSDKHDFGFWVAYSNKRQMEFNTAIY